MYIADLKRMGLPEELGTYIHLDTSRPDLGNITAAEFDKILDIAEKENIPIPEEARERFTAYEHDELPPMEAIVRENPTLPEGTIYTGKDGYKAIFDAATDNYEFVNVAMQQHTQFPEVIVDATMWVQRVGARPLLYRERFEHQYDDVGGGRLAKAETLRDITTLLNIKKEKHTTLTKN